MSDLYTLMNNNIFNNAEPYHYGTGAPIAGNFAPIGEDSNDQTTDYKIQAPEANGYSETKEISEFMVKNAKLSYIKKGTFPLPRLIRGFGSPYTAADDADEGVAGADYVYCKLTITYNNKKINTVTFNSYHGNKAADATSVTGDALESGGLLFNQTSYAGLSHSDEMPEKLGFVLVGGGGGAAGVTRYNASGKNGKTKGKASNDWYNLPGGGGGGGEIVWGVLDLLPPKDLADKATKMTYTVYLGNGGAGGKHGFDGWEVGVSADPGQNGYDSRLWVSIEGAGYSTPTLLLQACGGYGGGSSASTWPGSGGSGGSYSNNSRLTSLLLTSTRSVGVICNHAQGGKGGGAINESTIKNNAFQQAIYFSKTTPPPGYYISIDHGELSGSASNSTDLNQANVPGGHSFGVGAQKSSNPGWGAGGSCNATGGRDGCGGYFALYY